MAATEPTQGPSNAKKCRKSDQYTAHELLRVLEDSDVEFREDETDEGDWHLETAATDHSDDSVEAELSRMFRDSSESDDTGDDDEEIADDKEPALAEVSKPGVTWHEEPHGMQYHPFTKAECLLMKPAGNTPMDFFRLLVTDDILQLIVDETNDNARNIFASANTQEGSRISNWKPVSIEEIRVFLGISLHMGNVKCARLQDYWKRDPLFENKGITMSMSRDRYLLILRALHFAKNPESGEPKPNDRLYKIRPILNYFNNKMCNVYYPGRDLSLDESMILWRGRLSFRQYIKNKRNKYGIKLYMLNNPDGFINKCAVYTGMRGDMGGKGHAEKIVLHLLEEKVNVGHHIYMDNFYNSFALAKTLLNAKTHCTGTLRVNRKNTPKDVVCAKLGKGDTIARYSDGVMIGKWKDRREVSYISTEYPNTMERVQNARQQIVAKPLPIIRYNSCMSGTDRQDQMLSYYLCERKTIRWPKKLFFHVVDMLMFNAHYLYNKYSGHNMTLYDYRIQIIKGLLPPMDVTKGVRNKCKDTHVVQKRDATEGTKQVMRKRCKTCAARGKRTDTPYVCITCPNQPGFCLNCCTITHP
ncbi:piggyBac transposable element-derived protein 4-like [Schistocerca cancellata]|uniref:piggyBac transposable element-derived protein 4-like n=1 Tax=Schistocerca cancellata TaxID=274614 RepID=UPI002118A028|nr:piggyBac transposable element-derived protein 4-like [Schistocerca cancellata]